MRYAQLKSDERYEEDLRIACLELAIKKFDLPLHDEKGNMYYERCDLLANLANRFYDYIVKGK